MSLPAKRACVHVDETDVIEGPASEVLAGAVYEAELEERIEVGVVAEAGQDGMTVDATAPVICHRPCEALRGVGQDRASKRKTVISAQNCFASVVGWFLHRNAYVSIVKHHLLRCRAAVWALADDRYRAPRGDADLVRRGAGQEDGGENEGHEQYAWHVLRDGPAGKLASVSLLRPIQSTVSIGFPNAERACLRQAKTHAPLLAKPC